MMVMRLDAFLGGDVDWRRAFGVGLPRSRPPSA